MSRLFLVHEMDLTDRRDRYNTLKVLTLARAIQSAATGAVTDFAVTLVKKWPKDCHSEVSRKPLVLELIEQVANCLQMKVAAEVEITSTGFTARLKPGAVSQDEVQKTTVNELNPDDLIETGEGVDEFAGEDTDPGYIPPPFIPTNARLDNRTEVSVA